LELACPAVDYTCISKKKKKKKKKKRKKKRKDDIISYKDLLTGYIAIYKRLFVNVTRAASCAQKIIQPVKKGLELQIYTVKFL
jgi:hypothetical protein